MCSAIAAGLIFSGCGDDDASGGAGASSASTSVGVSSAMSSVALSSESSAASSSAPMAGYEVTVTNLSAAQPMSPLIVLLHRDQGSLYAVGTPASVALEHLAEGGDNAALLAETQTNATVQAVVGGNGLILPGGSDTVTLSGMETGCISFATMLVNTNDAFAGADCMDVSTLMPGESIHLNAIAFDAGTEANSEAAATIPGPAGGGEGFGAERDDRNFVTAHGGVVTHDDGLATSALGYMHRWDNPVVRVKIERVE